MFGILPRNLSFLLFTSLSLIVACVDEPPSGTSSLTDEMPERDRREPPRETPDTGENDGCLASLSILSGQNQTLNVGQTAQLTVRYADCHDAAVVDGNVSFSVVGDAADARLSVRNATTDTAGEVSVELTAGYEGAEFSVVAEALRATSVTFFVDVIPEPTGAIEVSLRYEGEEPHDVFDVSLHDGPCDVVDPFAPADTVRAATSVSRLTYRPTFTGVPTGSNHAVAVQASNGDDVLGSGCVDSILVIGGQTTTVSVTISDLPVVFSGVYTLDNELDLAAALPPSISSTLHIFDEMTDDNDLYGDHVTEDYGLDPAAFLLDFVYREFCCWEATGGNLFAECREQPMTHPLGDLSQIYIKDFQFWNGAQPNIDGACGVLEENNIITNTLGYTSLDVQQQVQDLILSSVPEAGLRLLEMSGDLSRAFTQMQIISELTILDVSEHKDGNFTHELKTMIVDVHDLDGVLHTTEFELAAAGLTSLSHTGVTTVVDGRLQIPEHDFQLDFGSLLLYVYQNVMLPMLECDPDWDGVHEPCASTTDLFATWIDCDSVGSWLGQLVGGLADFSVLCDWGLLAAGAYVDEEIRSSIDAETIVSLAGECEASELGERREAVTLVNGTWAGTLTEDTYTADFSGTFSGTRNEEE